jgi:hypothetical protein
MRSPANPAVNEYLTTRLKKKFSVGRQTDKWCFKYMPVKGFEVPHCVNLTLTDKNKGDYVNGVLVTLPDRQTPCSFCQHDTHWDS